MLDEGTINQPTALEAVALHYPEKTLYLGQVFTDTTNSYKLVWFLAILSLLRRGDTRSLTLAEVFTEMAVTAWHPVCLYRLSLGRQDKLQDVVLSIQRQFRLEPNAKPDAVRRFVDASAKTKAQLDYFKRYVPTRFLAPWFADKLRGTEDSGREGQIQVLAKESQSTPFATPYWLDGSFIRLNHSWRAFLVENMGVVQAFAEYHWALYLQARNPNAPGVVNKMQAPTQRQLAAAQRFWRLVRSGFINSGKPERFQDIYSERPLGDTFSIDHFLPWSFVTHDLLWNLTPVEPATNSSKNDSLPDLNTYLPRLANLHFAAIEAAKERPKLLEDYTDCFKLNVRELLNLGEEGLEQKYRDVIKPQTQIAINLGFQPGWRMRLPPVFGRAHRDFAEDGGPDRLARFSLEGAISERIVIEPFSDESQQKPGPEYLPYYSLVIAAGGFLAGDAPDPEGWVNAVKHGFSKRPDNGMFVTRVVGDSMAPTIKSGSYCVFRTPVEGTRQGRVVLVQKRSLADPETGGSYTVKRYQSAKSTTEDGWSHETILLIPDNPDRERFPTLSFSAKHDADLRVVAEFIQMLSSVI